MITSVRQFVLCIALIAGPLTAQNIVKPVVAFDFGGENANLEVELLRVGGVILTPKNEVVLVNGKPLALRVYDLKGNLLRKIGSEGAGPGEYRNSLTLYPWKGDTVLTRTGGTARWMLFSTAGKLVREWPVDSAHAVPGSYLLDRWAIARTTIVGTGGCLSTTMARMPGVTPWKPKFVTTDAAGRLWVQNSEARWQVYSAAGQSLAFVEFPDSLDIKQFNGDVVIGTRTDDDGGYHVTGYKVTLPPAGTVTKCPTAAPENARINEMKLTLVNMRTAAEAYFSGHKTYPSTVPNDLIQVPAGLTLTILQPSNKGMAVTVTDAKLNARCFYSNNTTLIPSHLDMAIICGK